MAERPCVPALDPHWTRGSSTRKAGIPCFDGSCEDRLLAVFIFIMFVVSLALKTRRTAYDVQHPAARTRYDANPVSSDQRTNARVRMTEGDKCVEIERRSQRARFKADPNAMHRTWYEMALGQAGFGGTIGRVDVGRASSSERKCRLMLMMPAHKH